MTDLRLAGRAGALLLPIALVIAACSGSTSSSAPSAAAGSSAGAGNRPSAAASVAPGGQLPTGSRGAIPSFDIGQLTAGLAKLDSYRVSITIGGVEQYKGTVVTKPVVSRDLIIPGNIRVVVIGDDAWVGTADGPLKATPGEMATTMFKNYDPVLMVAPFSGAGWAENAIGLGTETKNGVSSKHYRIDGTTLVGAFSGLPAGATIDVWIAEDKDYLVAVESSGFPAGPLSVQVTGVNDPANKVERPS